MVNQEISDKHSHKFNKDGYGMRGKKRGKATNEKKNKNNRKEATNKAEELKNDNRTKQPWKIKMVTTFNA